jgi:hypothetical protein
MKKILSLLGKTKAKRKGSQNGGGRPPIVKGEKPVAARILMSEEYAQYVYDLGYGNISAGVRKAIEIAMKQKSPT